MLLRFCSPNTTSSGSYSGRSGTWIASTSRLSDSIFSRQPAYSSSQFSK